MRKFKPVSERIVGRLDALQSQINLRLPAMVRRVRKVPVMYRSVS